MHTYLICENTIIIKKCIYFVIFLKNNLQRFPNVAIHKKILPFYENYLLFSSLVLKILNSLPSSEISPVGHQEAPIESQRLQ